jgi:calcium binding protein 39
MNQLRDESQNIQFEAFHVFKIFVAYPNKPIEISSVLYRNKAKLLAYLECFCTDSEDVQFQDERRLLIETLCTLEQPEEPKSVINNAAGGNKESQEAASSSLLG